MSEEVFEATNDEQRRVLAIVLALNVGLAAALAVGGVLADSSGLIADALDNAGDGAVYAISLYAVGRSAQWKRGAAAASGVLLLVFALGVLADTLRRYFVGSEPIGTAMMGLAVVAAVVNLICLQLLTRLRSDDVNLEAARTFSFNDFIANGGILVAGGLVLFTGQRWPDLLVGLAVALVALKGGVEIIGSARNGKGST